MEGYFHNALTVSVDVNNSTKTWWRLNRFGDFPSFILDASWFGKNVRSLKNKEYLWFKRLLMSSKHQYYIYRC